MNLFKKFFSNEKKENIMAKNLNQILSNLLNKEKIDGELLIDFINTILTDNKIKRLKENLENKKIEDSYNLNILKQFFDKLNQLKNNNLENEKTQEILIWIYNNQVFDKIDNHKIENNFENTIMYEAMTFEIETLKKLGIDTSKNEIGFENKKYMIVTIARDILQLKMLDGINKENEEEKMKNICLYIKKEMEKLDYYYNEETILFSSSIVENKEERGKTIEILRENNKLNEIKRENKTIKELEKEIGTILKSNYKDFGVCRDSSFIVLSIFQMLGFNYSKATLFIVPRHIAFRFILDNKNYFNFETNEITTEINREKIFSYEFRKYFIFPKDEIYERKFKFSKKMRTTFLKNLTKKVIMGFHRSNLANALFNLEKYKEALALYKEAVKLDPNNPDFKNNLASSLIKLGKYEEALALYKEAVKLDPNNPDFKYGLGYALLKLHKYEEALALYKEAVKLDPNNPDFKYGLGYALLKLHKYEEALALYKEAVKLDPNNPDFKKVLKICKTITEEKNKQKK